MLKKCLVLLCTLTISSASIVMAMEEYHAQYSARMLAFAMAGHQRLGAASSARGLPPSLLQNIMQLAYRPPHIVNLFNNFINPYLGATTEQEVINAYSEVLYFRIRDITAGEVDESPVIWQGKIARKNVAHNNNGEAIPTNAQIVIPEDITKIRIAVAPHFSGGLRINQSVYSYNAQNLQKIEACGNLNKSSSCLDIILHYNDGSQQVTQLLKS